MADLTLSVVAGDDLAERFTESAGAARMEMRHQLLDAMLKTETAMKRNIRTTLRRRSGALEESISHEALEETSAGLSGRVGSNMEYAEIQERGGEIHAKNAKNLTIPLEAFMTGRGIAKGSARDLIASPGDYGYDGTFFSRGVLLGKRGDEVEPLFVLKPSVTLPARPYAQPALDEIAPEFEASMRSALEALL